MNLLATSPLFAYSFLATVALLIFLLHLLRPRALRRVISSTLLWMAVIRAQRKFHAPWRWLLSLVLCLVIGLALAMALARPHGIGSAPARVVMLLDN
jgi:amino acid transporter